MVSRRVVLNCDRVRELARKELARRAALREAEPAASLYKPGDLLAGRWEVLRLHSGGMGIVYIVRDTIQQGSVEAAKSFRTFGATAGGSAGFRNALQREAEIWVRLGSHSNIVEARHIELIGPQLYIFMEYVEPDGQGRNSLRSFLEAGTISKEIIAGWAIQMCRGLRHAEANGLRCHRDIKPENILITSSGVVKITDFGLGRAYADLAIDPSLPIPTGVGTSMQQNLTGFTIARGIAGTAGYIAPEIVQGKPADIRSDIFSLGLVLHQMHTGATSPPWLPRTANKAEIAKDPHEAFYQRELETLAWRKESRPPELDSPLRAIIDRCLAFEPAERYQSFAELLKEMEELTGLPSERRLADTAKSIDAAVDELVSQANKLASLKKWEEALDCIRRGKDLDSSDRFLWNTEGVIYKDLGRYDDALHCFERAIELDPLFVHPLHNKGTTLRAMGRPAEALVCFEKAIAIEARHLDPWNSKGNCLQDLGRHEEAVAAYEVVLTMDPNFVWALREKGASLLELGRAKEAIACLRRALEIDPGEDRAVQLLEKAERQVKGQEA
jgi:eukaryotic-like serine/threonine-protein kinase